MLARAGMVVPVSKGGGPVGVTEATVGSIEDKVDFEDEVGPEDEEVGGALGGGVLGGGSGE